MSVPTPNLKEKDLTVKYPKKGLIMKNLITPFALIALASTSAMAACTATGFFRDGTNMTAAMIDPPGTVSGTVNATGCNIAVYYDTGVGTVDHADIFGSNYFGVLVNGDANIVAVNVTNSSIHDIGENPLNGSQHGAGIYYRSFFPVGSATGIISGNTLTHYQKGGIVANGEGVSVTISGNTVTGEGPVNYIAQNGIQVGYGASATVSGNTVTGHSYTGANQASSGGILVVGGPTFLGCPGVCPYTVQTHIQKNTLTGNDVGVWLANDNNGVPPPTPTSIKVQSNTITNCCVTNATGGGTAPYQAGISDEGNRDSLINNKISGAGYDPATQLGSTFSIDISLTTAPKVHANSLP
jgi:hypothetical protein